MAAMAVRTEPITSRGSASPEATNARIAVVTPTARSRTAPTPISQVVTMAAVALRGQARDVRVTPARRRRAPYATPTPQHTGDRMTVSTETLPVVKAKDFHTRGYMCIRPTLVATHNTASPSPDQTACRRQAFIGPPQGARILRDLASGAGNLAQPLTRGPVNQILLLQPSIRAACRSR